tara:strand:+ start:1680 stop:2036 length:357 start_codon:yes stop_codon:yes gene_type:complete
MYSSVQSWQMRRHEAREFGPFRLLSARRRHAWHGDEPIPRDSRASRSGIGCRRASVSVAILRSLAGSEIPNKASQPAKKNKKKKASLQNSRETPKALDKIREHFDEEGDFTTWGVRLQ